MTNPTAPPAGWYSDGEQPGMNRWWDGVDWSEHRQPAAAAASADSVAAPAVAAPAPVPPPAKAPTRASAAAVSGGTLFSGEPVQPGERMTVFPLAERSEETPPEDVNKPANSGFTLGILSIPLGLFGITGIVSIIQSVRGLNRAKELEARGVANTGKSKATWGIALSVASFIIVGISLSLFIGSQQPATLDSRAFESTITSQLSDQGVSATTVSCPDDITMTAGRVMHCEVKLDDGTKSLVTVTFENDKGAYSWQIG
jgi:hypothetical protein